MSGELKPCPLCGGKGILYVLRRNEYIVQCESCGLTTANCEIEERTRQMWNGRVRLKTWSKAVIPWGPFCISEQSAIKIEMLDVSVKLFNVLHRHGIKTVGDILRKSPEEIRNYRGIGPAKMSELKTKLMSILEKDVYAEWEKERVKL